MRQHREWCLGLSHVTRDVLAQGGGGGGGVTPYPTFPPKLLNPPMDNPFPILSTLLAEQTKAMLPCEFKYFSNRRGMITPHWSWADHHSKSQKTGANARCVCCHELSNPAPIPSPTVRGFLYHTQCAQIFQFFNFFVENVHKTKTSNICNLHAEEKQRVHLNKRPCGVE